MFALRQALAGWEFYQQQVRECDEVIERVLKDMQPLDDPTSPPPDTSKRKPDSPNGPHIDDLHRMLVCLCGGCDVTALPGIADYSLLQLIGEVGTDLRQWPSEKHFTAWLGLAPGSRQSGKRRGHVARQRNRAGRLFSMLAQSLARSVDKALGGFYRRLRARRGGLVANQALARKLASMFWKCMVHGSAYVERGLKHYEQQVAETEQRRLQKLARQHGFKLIPIEAAPAKVPG